MEKQNQQVQEYLNSAHKWMESKMYDRAMIEFNKALSIDADSTGQVLNLLYEQAKSSGNYQGIITVGSNMLTANPENVNLANLIGNAYRKTGNKTQAIKLYEHVLKINPKAITAEYNISAVLANTELYDNAVIDKISEFEKMEGFKLPSYERSMDDFERIQLQYNAYNEKEGGTDEEIVLNPQEIFSILKKEAKPSDEKGAVLLKDFALLCLDRKVPKMAWKIFTRLIAKNKNNEDLKVFLAVCYFGKGDTSIGIESLLRILGQNPYNRYANVNLGFMHQINKHKRLSRKYYLLVAELLEKTDGYYDMEQYRKKGDDYYDMEDYKKALAIYKTIQNEIEDVELLMRLVKLHFKSKDYNECLLVLAKIQKIAPENPEAKKFMEEVYGEIINQAEKLYVDRVYKKAVDFYEKALTIKKTEDVLLRLESAYSYLKQPLKVNEVKELLFEFKEEVRLAKIEKERMVKVEDAKGYIKQKNYYKAIRSYEEALRSKADKELFSALINLYKKTKQNSMIEDLTQRFNKQLDRERNMEQLKAEQERLKRIHKEDNSKGEESK